MPQFRQSIAHHTRYMSGMWFMGRRIADADLAAFYREQASRMARRALVVSNKKARLELMEMAATFQRLALREEGPGSSRAANSNTSSPDEDRLTGFHNRR